MKMIVNNPTLNAASLVALTSPSLLVDSDNDGLPDWEETLRKTDPHNPDTDHDGITDDKEVFSHETVQQRIDEIKKSLPTEKLTETEKFGRELLVQYLEFKKQGKKIDEQTSGDIAKKLLESIAEKTNFTLYNPTNVQSISRNDAEFLREYGNRMGRIIMRNAPTETVSVPTLLTEALENKDPSQLEKIAPLVESFENSLKEALMVPIPSDLVKFHIDLMNAFSITATSLEGLRSTIDDPLVGIARIGQYQQGIGFIRVSLQGISDYYKQNNIVFEPGEEGTMFIGIL